MSLFQVSAFAVFERSLERTTVTFSFNGAASANRKARAISSCAPSNWRARAPERRRCTRQFEQGERTLPKWWVSERARELISARDEQTHTDQPISLDIIYLCAERVTESEREKPHTNKLRWWSAQRCAQITTRSLRNQQTLHKWWTSQLKIISAWYFISKRMVWV